MTYERNDRYEEGLIHRPRAGTRISFIDDLEKNA